MDEEFERLLNDRELNEQITRDFGAEIPERFRRDLILVEAERRVDDNSRPPATPSPNSVSPAPESVQTARLDFIRSAQAVAQNNSVSQTVNVTVNGANTDSRSLRNITRAVESGVNLGNRGTSIPNTSVIPDTSVNSGVSR